MKNSTQTNVAEPTGSVRFIKNFGFQGATRRPLPENPRQSFFTRSGGRGRECEPFYPTEHFKADSATKLMFGQFAVKIWLGLS